MLRVWMIFIMLVVSTQVMSHQVEKELEKTYICPYDIQLTEKGAHVYLEGEWLFIKQLYWDDGGAYILQDHDFDGGVTWKCESCGKNNSHFKKRCIHCGAYRF